MRSLRPLEQILTSRDGPVLVVPPHSHERNRERVRDHLGHAIWPVLGKRTGVVGIDPDDGETALLGLRREAG